MPRLTPEQLASRKQGMGATDVVEALNLSPYEGAGPMRLYLQKTSDDVEDEGQHDKPWLDWGHVLEPIILADYVRQTGRSVVPGGEVRSRVHPWLWATLDATVLGEDRNVEVKNVASNMAHGWDSYDDGGIPRHVRAQVMIGMHCTGKRLCDVVASVGGRPPYIWTVAFDEELCGLLVDGAARFWEMVQHREAPPLDATSASKEYLRRKYPSNVDRVIRDATAQETEIAQRRATYAGILKGAEANLAKCDAQLLDLIGTSDGIAGDFFKMTWKLDKNGVRRQRFTSKGDE